MLRSKSKLRVAKGIAVGPVTVNVAGADLVTVNADLVAAALVTANVAVLVIVDVATTWTRMVLYVWSKNKVQSTLVKMPTTPWLMGTTVPCPHQVMVPSHRHHHRCQSMAMGPSTEHHHRLLTSTAATSEHFLDWTHCTVYRGHRLGGNDMVFCLVLARS